MNLRRLTLHVCFGIVASIVYEPAATRAATHVVGPGESIQAAVDAASPGDTIAVMPGTYVETHGGQNAVTVTKDRIRLIGRTRRSLGEAGKVIIEPGANNINGIVLQGTEAAYLRNMSVRGFTVRGFPNNGIVTRYVHRFRILDNESVDNLENGIWPILSSNGLVRRNTSYGSNDSALWVEDSVNIRVVRNVIHSSVTGIEVSQSDDVYVARNETYNNSTGIGVYMQPGRVRKETNRTRVVDNHVHDNNKPNTAPPGSMAADLPEGGGILLLGPDTSLVEGNQIENNRFYGVALVDYCWALFVSDFNCVDNPPDMDPTPQGNRIADNTLVGNGTAPPDHPLAPRAADLVGFAPGNQGNCWSGNTYTTSNPLTLPGCS